MGEPGDSVDVSALDHFYPRDEATTWLLDTLDSKKESDRGAVLVCATYLDELLARLLMAYFELKRSSQELQGASKSKSKAAKSLLEGIGSVANFSSRIKLAYVLGLINEWEYENFEIVRKIRNHFAHKLGIVDFSDKEVAELVRELRAGSGREYNPDRAVLRGRFELTCAFLGGTLVSSAEVMKKAETIEGFWKERSNRYAR